jgi:hypothetical protein
VSETGTLHGLAVNELFNRKQNFTSGKWDFMKRITEFIAGWSPLHLRRRIEELEIQIGGLKFELNHVTERLFERRDDLVNGCQQYVIKENERLRKENVTLRHVSHCAKMNAIALKGIAQSFIDACEKQEKGDQQ